MEIARSVGAYAVSIVDWILLEAANPLVLPLQLLVAWLVERAFGDSRVVDRCFSVGVTGATGFGAVWLSWVVFRWFSQQFTMIPVIVMLALALLYDWSYVTRALRVWHACLKDAGLEPAKVRPDEQDSETRMLYDDVGRGFQYVAGHLLGFGGGAWAFLR